MAVLSRILLIRRVVAEPERTVRADSGRTNHLVLEFHSIGVANVTAPLRRQSFCGIDNVSVSIDLPLASRLTWPEFHGRPDHLALSHRREARRRWNGCGVQSRGR